MVAALYDASLDAFLPHNWRNLEMFRQDYSHLNVQFQNMQAHLRNILGHFDVALKPVGVSYRILPPEIVSFVQYRPSRMLGRARGGMSYGGGEGMPAPAVPDGKPVPSIPEGKPAPSIPTGKPAPSVPKGKPAPAAPTGKPRRQ